MSYANWAIGKDSKMGRYQGQRGQGSKNGEIMQLLLLVTRLGFRLPYANMVHWK